MIPNDSIPSRFYPAIDALPVATGPDLAVLDERLRELMEVRLWWEHEHKKWTRLQRTREAFDGATDAP